MKRQFLLNNNSQMKHLFIALVLTITACAHAQTYKDSIETYRKQYVKELLADKRSPIKAADVKYMHFFPADHAYCVWGDVTLSPGSKPFLINTHSGKQKPFKEYGTITFKIKDTMQTLHIYQMVDMMSGKPTSDELFVPFNDMTNYETTYAGGRYIDLFEKDMVNNQLLIDFNKCYNPYCAFADGFSCPIPPDENHLKIAVTAGEMMFSKNMGY